MYCTGNHFGHGLHVTASIDGDIHPYRVAEFPAGSSKERIEFSKEANLIEDVVLGLELEEVRRQLVAFPGPGQQCAEFATGKDDIICISEVGGAISSAVQPAVDARDLV